MNIVMTGASGLVGTALVKKLVSEGHTISRLQRPGSKKQDVGANGVADMPWTPGAEISSMADAVINLAGAPIAEGRWTPERKALLRSSRVDTTRGLVNAIAKMEKRPRVMISASAVGYYGDRGDELLTENSGPGRGFLADLAKEWEAEVIKAEALGVRVVRARFGVILAKQGGALPQMMKPFKVGLGGKLGSGRQWMSWVTLEDVVAILRRALMDEGMSGAMNVVGPAPVTNAEFTKTLGKAMQRPAIFAAPAFVLRLAMGEMADGALLASERALPKRLEDQGYRFRHPDLPMALAAVLDGAGNVN